MARRLGSKGGFVLAGTTNCNLEELLWAGFGGRLRADTNASKQAKEKTSSFGWSQTNLK